MLSAKQIDDILHRLTDNKPVRRSFPENGRLHMDRQLPFICVYRNPSGDKMGETGRMIISEAAYLLVSGKRSHHKQLSHLLEEIIKIMVDRFGAFLILEVWASENPEAVPDGSPPRAGFFIHQSHVSDINSTAEELKNALGDIKTLKQKADVFLCDAKRIAPPGMSPLIPDKRLHELGCEMLGLEINPIYINPRDDSLYPLLFRSLKHQLGHALDKTFYAFAHDHTTHQPTHYHSLGRRAMVKAVWDVDRRLAAVSNSFDLLFQITPINAEQAWKKFRRSRFEKTPVFMYRPRSVDPSRLKRVLYDVPIERVEDPTIMHLYLDKQLELDRQITMLHDLGTKQFMYESLQLHGAVSASLLRTAKNILAKTPSRTRSGKNGKSISSEEFARVAREEVAWYLAQNPGFKASVIVSKDMYSGLMVSRGRLLIGKETRIPHSRVAALMQHEIGTHLLTYYNGQAQPFKMLYTGLPGYDELQEGLAVLSEYLVGGLSAARLRVLAARVVAAHAVIDGASFVDVFRMLDNDYAFNQRTAYTITMRIFRGGGLLKDAVYLRGLVDILKHIANGADFDILYSGKIAAGHIPVIRELMLRKVLNPLPSYPRHLDEEDVRIRLKRLRKGVSVLDLLKSI